MAEHTQVAEHYNLNYHLSFKLLSPQNILSLCIKERRDAKPIHHHSPIHSLSALSSNMPSIYRRLPLLNGPQLTFHSHQYEIIYLCIYNGPSNTSTRFLMNFVFCYQYYRQPYTRALSRCFQGRIQMPGKTGSLFECGLSCYE